MYYDNKSTFYVKQYGPAVLILILSFVLIGSGIYIYVNQSSTSKTPDQEIIIASDKLEDETKIEEDEIVQEQLVTEEIKEEVVVEQEEILSELPQEYSNLKELEKSSDFTFDKVLDSKQIRLTIPNTSKKIDVTLIGVNFNNSISDVITKMENDLKEKTIKLSFDKVKVDNSKIYAYIYINDELYNAKILENGYATFQEEPKNKSLSTELKQSQTFAKQLSAGIWAN